MARRLLILGLLAISLAAPGSYAQTPPAAAPAAAPPAANPVDPAAVQALKDMGAYLLKLKRCDWRAGPGRRPEAAALGSGQA
jgi:hypothetical protein